MPTSRRAFLVSALAASAFPARGADDLAPFDKLFDGFLETHRVPGAAVAVTRGGKLVYARGFGRANVEKKLPVRADTRFRIASVSKPLTGVAVMMLAEQKKFALDDTVLKHIALKPFAHKDAKPDPRWAEVTIRQCLQHTGGWDRDRTGGFDPIGIPGRITDQMKLAGPPTPDDVVRYMMGARLDFDPGTKAVYSNLGYLVLGRVIEAVTGAKYEPWVKKNVLAPLGITGMALGRALPQNRTASEASYYDARPDSRGRCLYPPKVGELVPWPDGGMNVEGFEAHGGWVASAVDLVRFASAFDYGTKSPLLSAGSITEMWTRPKGAAGTEADGKPRAAYLGCGWMVRPVGNTGRANTWHTGLIAGTSALLVRRSDGLNWAVLFNTDANPDDKRPADLIDPLMHEAANTVKAWPAGDPFPKVK